MKKLVFILAMVGLFVLSGCNEPLVKVSYTVTIGEVLVQEAVDSIQQNNGWALGLMDVSIDYVRGVTVEGAVVLHNGGASDKLVILSVDPGEDKVRKSDGIAYSSMPFLPLSTYVEIENTVVRLNAGETKVVKVSLIVPDTVKDLPDNWTFAILASGQNIVKNTVEMEITTEATTEVYGQVVPDDFLLVSFDVPLLNNSLNAVTRVESSIPETLIRDRYLPDSRELKLTGLTPSSTRVVTIDYETTDMISIAYKQQWYINMQR